MVNIVSLAAKQLPSKMFINSINCRSVTILIWILCKERPHGKIIRWIIIMNGNIMIMVDFTVYHKLGQYGLPLDNGLLISNVFPINRALFEITCRLTSHSLFSSFSNQWEEISPLGTFDSRWLTVLFQLWKMLMS